MEKPDTAFVLQLYTVAHHPDTDFYSLSLSSYLYTLLHFPELHVFPSIFHLVFMGIRCFLTLTFLYAMQI